MLGDRCLPPWKPCMIIFTGCLGLKWDAYSDSGSVTSNRSGFFCVSLRKTRKRITHGPITRDGLNVILRNVDKLTEKKGRWWKALLERMSMSNGIMKTIIIRLRCVLYEILKNCIYHIIVYCTPDVTIRRLFGRM